MLRCRLKEIKETLSQGNPLVLELVGEIENLRNVLSRTQGSLHIINSRASTIRRWINDPNLHPAEEAKAIEDERYEAHNRISEVLFPREEEIAEKLMEKT